MNNFMEFAGFATAIIASIGLALGLEWLGLNGLFRLMPKAARVRPGGTEGRRKQGG